MVTLKKTVRFSKINEVKIIPRETATPDERLQRYRQVEENRRIISYKLYCKRMAKSRSIFINYFL